MDSDEKTGGVYCIYRNCKNTFHKCRGSGVKFFRVPKDETMCKKWIQASGREDLLHCSEVINLDKFHNYRVCSDHFGNEMFNNPFERSRLLGQAEPYRFEEPQLMFIGEPSTSGSLQLSSKRPLPGDETAGTSKRVKIVSDILIKPSTQRVPLPQHSPVETQTSTSLSVKTPRKLKLKEKIDVLTTENKALKSELSKALHTINNPTENDFKQMCDTFLNKELSTIVKSQVDLLKRSDLGRRYTDKFKQFALTLYFLSPKCYKKLSKTFCLPSKSSLCRFVQNIRFSTGINPPLFESLKLTVSRMDKIDTFCTICLDELSIKSNLFYNFGTDTVVGFEDNGEARGNKPASAATVVMVRGLKSSWKQPVAYTLSPTNYNAAEMKHLLDGIVTHLKKIGLQVVALISDMGSNCIELAKNLGVTVENPKITLGNEEMFYFFDPPHLIKAARNNLLNNDYKIEHLTASWSDIPDNTCYPMDVQFLSNRGPVLGILE